MSQQRPNARRTSKRPTVARGEQKQVSGQSEPSSLPSIRPSNGDHAAWLAYWQEQNQPWRTEPEISPERRGELEKRRALVPDIEKGIYPFKGIKLDRADVEWLLTTHEGGPVNWSDEKERVCEGLDVRGADLQEANLHELPLTRLRGGLTSDEWLKATEEQRSSAVVLMRGAKLYLAQLEEANLIGAQLAGANLSRAQLAGASLIEAQLEGAILMEAQLAGANLMEARLKGAYLRRAQLKGAELSGAQLVGASLIEAQLEGARLIKAQLAGASLIGAQLEGARLIEAQLAGADLSRAQLKGAILIEAQLEGADLSRAQLVGAILIEAQLGRANLILAQLAGADLSRAQLKGANLIGAQLKGAYLIEAQLEGVNLSEAQLEGADLSRARLKGVDLSKAQLEGADLSGARLEGVDLREVILGDKQRIGPRLADLQWGDNNLAVVDWSQVDVLGDEREARQKKTPDGKKKEQAERLSEYQAAVRANRQLAVALQSQGLSEEAARFAYRAQRLQRIVLRRQWRVGSYLFSGFLDLIAGYGYRPGRTVLWYLCVIVSFAVAYFALGHLPPFPDALVFSLMSFHGRGFFPSLSSETSLHNQVVEIAAIEAVVGLLIEISFIATFTQRYFGK